MAKVSIIIPSRNETYPVNTGETVLVRMIKDIYEKNDGDFEVLVAFDGPPYQDLSAFPNLRSFELPQKGLKYACNLLANEAKGKYLFKLDSHCMVSENITDVLQADMEDNWVVTPRFYVLNAEEWKFQNEKFFDFCYLPCPLNDKKNMFRFQAGQHWTERTQARLHIPIDENMKLSGSSWFVTKDYFLNKVGGFRPDWIDESHGEEIELSLKTWLGPWGGKLMSNKKCWYAHMTKGYDRPRGWRLTRSRANRTYLAIADYWMKDSWEGAIRPLSWLIEKFEPVPRWKELGDWREVYDKWKEENPINQLEPVG